MRDVEEAPLGAFALYVQRPAWIDGEPVSEKERSVIVWNGAGPYDVPICALREGFIIFEFDRSPTYTGGGVPSYVPVPGTPFPREVSEARRNRDALAYSRFGYMNAFLCGLYSGWSIVQKRGTPVQPPIDPTNFAWAEKQNEAWNLRLVGDGKIGPREGRDLLSSDTVAYAVDLMHRTCAHFGERAIDLLILVYLACHQYARHQHPSAHLMAWTAIEMQLNTMWSALIKEVDSNNGGHTAINKDRRKLLEGGRDYTASVITQILSLSRKLDDGLLSQLDDARRKRNAFAHSLEPILANDAGGAIRTATDLMTKLLGVKVTSQLSMLFHL